MEDPGQDQRTVVVVGGGISGLTAAWHLASRAPGTLRVVVLERSDRVGGLLRTGEVGGLQIDLGAESVLARRPQALELIHEVGLGSDLEHPVTAAANLWSRGRLHRLPAGTVMGVPGSVRGLSGLLTTDEVDRVAREPDVPSPPLDHDVDVASYVASRMGRAVVDRLVEPLLGGVYAGHASRLSLRATLPTLWEQARRGGSLTETVAAGQPADDVPLPPVFAGVRGGVGRLPIALAAALAGRGVEVRCGVTVRGLERTAPGWRVVTGPASAPQVLDADAVVVAVPAPAAARLLAGHAPVAAAELAGVETASVAVVAAVVPRAVLAGTAGSGILVPAVEALSVKAVTFSAAKWGWVDALDPDRVPVRLSLGRAREEVVLQRDDADLVALALADLSSMLGVAVRAEAARVVRWGGSLPQYAVGHLDRVARVRADVAGVAGLAVCGSVLDGVGVPACVGAARAAAQEVLADLGGPWGTMGP